MVCVGGVPLDEGSVTKRYVNLGENDRRRINQLDQLPPWSRGRLRGGLRELGFCMSGWDLGADQFEEAEVGEQEPGG
jgi:hypothetical protein